MGAVARIPRTSDRLTSASLFLILTTALNAVFGFAFWLACARLFPAATVGIGSAAVSALTLVASFGWFGLQQVLLRFLPIAGPHRGRLIIRTYQTAIVTGVLVALGFVLLFANLLDAHLLTASPVAILVFLAAVAVWIVFSLQDPALIALQRAKWVPIENAFFGALKLVCVAVLAAAGLSSAWVIFGSWTAGAGVLVIIISVLLRRRVLSAPATVTADELPDVRRVARFAARHQAVSITQSLPDFLVPLLVLSLVSKAATAHYYAVYTIAYSLRLLAINIASALTVAGVHDRERLRQLLGRVARLTTLLVLPCALVCLVGADLLLDLFGHGYRAEGATLLRLFALAMPCSAVIVVGLAVERVHERWGRAFIAMICASGTTIGLDLALLPSRGLTGAGEGWLAGQVVGAALIGGLVLRREWVDVTATAGDHHPPRHPVARARLRRVATHGLTAPLIAAAGLALAAIALAGDRLHLDDLGLISSLGPGFIVGAALLPVAGFLELTRARRRPWITLGTLFAFVALVWLAPLVLEGTPRFRTAYQSWGYVSPILRGVGLEPRVFVYHNWPLFPLLFAGVSWVTGLGAIPIMSAFPTVIALVWVGLTVGVLREVAPERRIAGVLLGGWLFVMFDWSNQDYFSPQALAFAMFLGLLWILAHAAIHRDGELGRTPLVAALALYAGIVATHALTSMIALALIVVLAATGSLRRRGLALIFALEFLAWQGYIAKPFYVAYAPHLRGALFSLGFFSANASSRVAGAPGHRVVTEVLTALALLMFGLGALAAVASRARRREPAWRFCVAGLVTIIVITPLSAYGGEMLIRAVLFSLPFVVGLIAQWNPRGRLLALGAALSVVLVPVHILAYYGNELYDHVTPAEIAGDRFIAGHLAPARIYGGYPGGVFLDSAAMQWRNAVVPNAAQGLSLAGYRSPEDRHWRKDGGPLYVALGEGDEAAARLYFNRPDFGAQVRALLASQPQRYRVVFHNSGMEIWRVLPTPTAPTG